MQDTKDNEFITKNREYKPPYETEIRADGTKIVKIDTKRKLKPRDREMIQALVIAGYKEIYKRKDITMSEMIKYVKENYDQQELNLLKEKLDSINEDNKENSRKITFATIKSWFKERYIYYPKGLNWNFGSTKSAKEKKERFIKVFNEHKKALKGGNESKDNNKNNNNK